LTDVAQNNFPKCVYKYASLAVNFAKIRRIIIVCSDRQTYFSEAVGRSHFSCTTFLRKALRINFKIQYSGQTKK